MNNSVNATIFKPSGSDVYTIEFYEKWPVKLSSSKNMSYKGEQINSRDFVGNNRDYIGSNFLYNHELIREQSINMKLERLNATVFATDEKIDSAAVMATRDTEYHLQSHSTGIAALKYRQVADDGSVLNEDDQRYSGVYDIDRSIRMKSRFDLSRTEDSWLPCCSGGFSSMNPLDQRAFKSAKGVFDCTCFDSE